jgi:hypothetical protein
VIAIQVIIDNTKPTIEIHKPISGESISGIVKIEGESYDVNGVKNISLTITHIEQIDISPIVINITPEKEIWEYELNTSKYHEGFYNLSAHAFDGLHTNTTNITVIIDNNKPPEILYSPTNDTIKIKENSTQEFRIVNAADPEGGNITIRWYWRKKLGVDRWSEWLEIGASYNLPSYLFETNYTSWDSSFEGDYGIKVEVWDNFWDKEAAVRIWTLTVENVNRIPTIISYTPKERELVINENSFIEFYVVGTDIDGEALLITWKVNNDAKAVGSYYNFTTNYRSAGSYKVEVILSDGIDSISQVWWIVVKNVNRLPTADFNPARQLNVTAPIYQTFYVDNLYDPDGDNLTITWYVNGKVVQGEIDYKYIHLFDTPGRWNISVEVSDGEAKLFYSWLVNVAVEKGRYVPVFEFGLAVVAILATILIILIVRILRKKRVAT